MDLATSVSICVSHLQVKLQTDGTESAQGRRAA